MSTSASSRCPAALLAHPHARASLQPLSNHASSRNQEPVAPVPLESGVQLPLLHGQVLPPADLDRWRLRRRGHRAQVCKRRCAGRFHFSWRNDQTLDRPGVLSVALAGDRAAEALSPPGNVADWRFCNAYSVSAKVSQGSSPRALHDASEHDSPLLDGGRVGVAIHNGNPATGRCDPLLLLLVVVTRVASTRLCVVNLLRGITQRHAPHRASA